MEAEVAYVRDNFQKKFAENCKNGLYDERDLSRLRTDDEFVTTYIRGKDRLDEGVELVHESFKWRHEMKVQDLTEDSFERWVWERGAVFFHNHDKDGNPILLVRVKEHKKDPQLLILVKKYLAYWLETSFKERPTGQIVVFFDMTETGLANLDMELIRYVITCFKYYYPTHLAYMLIYEMPWIFNAAWRVVKAWLSAEAVARLKFVTKADVQAYINRDQLLEHMGGTDKFKYSYIPPEERAKSENSSEEHSGSALRKRVTFADQDSITEDNNNTNSSKMSISIQSSCSTSHQHIRQRESGPYIGRLLTITPSTELEFSMRDQNDPYDIISLTNTLGHSIAYKVKTTAPEKYRVRPSSGIVKPGTTTEVYVYLQSGFRNSVHKDKFLVMAMELTNESCDNVAELWKTVPKDNIMEHRLCCIHATHSKVIQSRSKGTISDTIFTEHLERLCEQMDGLQNSNQQLQRRVKWLTLSHIVLAACTLVIVISAYLFYSQDMHIPPCQKSVWNACSTGLF